MNCGRFRQKGKQKIIHNARLALLTTLDSGINIGVRLLIFGLFSRGYFLIREGNAFLFLKYPLFYGMGDTYFKGYA